VIEPGSRAAIDSVFGIQQPQIAVIATEATVRSQAYEKAIARKLPAASVSLTPTPLLVPIIEDGRDASCPLAKLAVEQYLTPVALTRPDVLVLGCTHYPILRLLITSTLARLTGAEVPVVDSAEHCAQDVARRLAVSNLLRDPSGPAGSLQCWVTDDSPRFARLASRFLGYSIPGPQWVSPEELVASTPARVLRQAV
jgi:glutamate racemase